jgi:hypothetical protein
VTRRDPWATIGLVVVGVTALIWSFTALSDLAHRCGVTAVIQLWDFQAHVSWGLPITVDVLALVATRVWLNRAAPEEAVTYARRAAWSAIVATVIGNGYHGLLVGNFAVDAVIVSAAPAVVIGVIVHLAVLVGRPDATRSTDEGSTADQAPMLWLTDEAAALDAEGFRKLAEQFETAPDRQSTEFVLPDRRAAIDTDNLVAICDDLRAIADEAGRPLTQDEVRQVYGIGSEKAGKVRRQLGWWPRAVDQSDESKVAAR